MRPKPRVACCLVCTLSAEPSIAGLTQTPRLTAWDSVARQKNRCGFGNCAAMQASFMAPRAHIGHRLKRRMPWCCRLPARSSRSISPEVDPRLRCRLRRCRPAASACRHRHQSAASSTDSCKPEHDASGSAQLVDVPRGAGKACEVRAVDQTEALQHQPRYGPQPTTHSRQRAAPAAAQKQHPLREN